MLRGSVAMEANANACLVSMICNGLGVVSPIVMV